MFPLRDHNPSNRTPFVTWALIIANVLVFFTYYPAMAGAERQLMAFYADWALVPAEVLTGRDTHTLFTSMFLHGGWMHLLGNMLFLWIFGDNMEDLLGHLRFAAFYIASGLAAAAGQILAGPGSTIPMVGASGAIAGVMGGYLLFFPRARIDVLVIIVVLVRVFAIPAWLMLGLWFGLQLVNGLSMDAAGGGVAYWAHAGGFAAGWRLCCRFGCAWAAPISGRGGMANHPMTRWNTSSNAAATARSPRCGACKATGPPPGPCPTSRAFRAAASGACRRRHGRAVATDPRSTPPGMRESTDLATASTVRICQKHGNSLMV